jgi:flagellar biosynthesis protein FlhF
MIKKFHAQTTRDALRQVRDALGASALILSNRQVAGGVEIIAVADMDMAALAAQAEPALWKTQPPPRPQTAPAAPPPVMQPMTPPMPPQTVAAPAIRSGLTLDEAKPQLTKLADYLAERDVSSLIRPSPSRVGSSAAQTQPASVVQPPAQPAGKADPSTPQHAIGADAVDELAKEMRLLRGMVEGQLAGFAWNDLTRRDPVRMEAMKRLLAAGFSAAFARMLLERLPADEADLAQSLKWIKTTIAHNLKLAARADDIVERGGVYALVGPTGVGKTTTVAKLAARAVLRHGAAKVALVTTDTYRIGAQDQLRIYGRILGTPVFAVRDENDLEMTLSDLSGRHLVFVDTVGMSQRDKRLAEQVALLCGEQRDVKRLLLLGAPSQGVTLEEVARAYSGPGLIGCILTKIDEALTYGPVLDVAIRHELPVHYVTNGQRVPEDLHLANANYLADRAFRIHQPESPFTQDENDYPILMAAALQTAASPDLNDSGALGGWGATG